MRMRCFGILLVSQIVAGNLSAQSDGSDVGEGIVTHISFVGALKYPGLKLGADYKLVSKEVVRSRRGAAKLIRKNRFVTTNLGFYHHNDYNTNFFLQAGYQWQRVGGKGWYRVLEPQIGLSRTFIAETVYQVGDDGEVGIKKGAGHLYAAPSLSLGLGKDFSVRNSSKPYEVFAKITLFTNMPYNNFVYVRMMGEVGVSYHLRVMQHRVKMKYKES